MNRVLFDQWNEEKQIIHNTPTKRVFINTREIWLTKMGHNIGFEENGKDNFLRPVLVIKVVGNMFFTTSLTTNGKDKKRFFKNIRIVAKEEFKEIKLKLRELLL